MRKGLERFEKRIQDITGEHSIGKELMGKAFNRQNPLIAINDGTSGNDPSEQEGFMHLTMGAMAGMRNLYSHGDVDTMQAIDALERLAFISLLFKRVDAAQAGTTS
ncbi:MAG TPA: TIGR02391 family protein [Planctomycetaceae bacterium]|nr:TIGR02391 family protein [Planctomycetaceae bacterium]